MSDPTPNATGRGPLQNLKTLALIKRRPDLSRDAFREHYEGVHAPLAIETVLEGTSRYVRYHLLGEIYGRPRFDVVTAFWYRSAEDALAIQERVAGSDGDAIRRDELTFMDKPANSFFAVIEQTAEGDEGVAAPFRAVVLARAPEGAHAADFVASYEKVHVPKLRTAVRTPTWCLQHRVLPGSEGRPDFDAVTLVHAEADAGLADWARSLAGGGAQVVVASVLECESELPR